ncbi:MAG: hypothetical protein LBP38_01015 [Desulfovibrio sp.]|jgi:hypothetical protein|nr:hypothetical protein [Desulfovibrio sp.]
MNICESIYFYSLGKASFNMLAHIFDRWPSLIYRWLMEAGAKLTESSVSGEIRQIEFDEMWHFIHTKKESFGTSRPLTVAHGELCLGFRNCDTATFKLLEHFSLGMLA